MTNLDFKNLKPEDIKAFASTLVDIRIYKPDGDVGIISIQKHKVKEFQLAINKMLLEWHMAGNFYTASNQRWKRKNSKR